MTTTKTLSYNPVLWGRTAIAFAAVTLTSMTVMVPKASAAPALTGQCRAAKQQTAIFKDRSSTSAVVDLLKADGEVTLAENSAQDGLIAVSAPAKGFVQTVNLKMCAGQSPVVEKPTEGSTCRVVTQPIGLLIRKEPGTNEVVGGVGVNEKITLVSPMESKDLSDGRTWVKIEKPVMGWISAGITKGAQNIAPCK